MKTISRCYKCGIEKEMASNALCVDCMNFDTPVVKELKFKSVQVCQKCGSYCYFKEWHKEKKSLHEMICETIDKGLKINPIYDLEKIEIKEKPLERESTPKKHFYDVEVKLGLHLDYDFTFIQKVHFHQSDSFCSQCLKYNNNYFEGILQIRGKDNERYAEVENFILGLVNKRKDVEIHKIERNVNGLDIYVTNKRVLLEIAQKAHNEFGGHLEQNSQLFSWNKQTSKDVFRLNVLMRLPDFEKYDLIEINGSKIVVKKVRGKKVFGINIQNHKDQEFDFNNNSYEIIARKENSVQKTTISKIYPEIEVLNESYESVPIINLTEKEEKFKTGHNVSVLNYEGKYYLIK